MMIQGSLFDAPVEPVLAPASGWVEGALSGSAVVSLCVLAVSLFAIGLFYGHVPLRRGLTIALGCFVVFGAGNVAAGLLSLDAQFGQDRSSIETVVLPNEKLVEKPLPPANYDPYAGASLRREGHSR